MTERAAIRQDQEPHRQKEEIISATTYNPGELRFQPEIPFEILHRCSIWHFSLSYVALLIAVNFVNAPSA